MSKLSEHLVNEESSDRNWKYIADAYTRFLLGDRKAAIKLLSKFTDTDLNLSIESDSKEYNKQWARVFKGILEVIEREGK